MILFLFIILYGGCFLLAEYFSNLIGIPHVITAFVILIYAVVLILFMLRQRKGRYLYGINIKFKPSAYLYFVPLLIMPVINLIVLDNSFSPFTIITFIGACVVEEIFFRNYLFFYLNQKFSITISIVLSSVIFALFHTVNLFNSLDLLFITLQIFSAFCVGVCFGAITYKFKSITPCFISHFIINLTGIGVLAVDRLIFALLIGASSLLYFLYGLFLLLNRKTTNEIRRY